MKEKLIKIIQDLAPILAGFQITATLVGSIGLGAIANWILVHWIPFTRFVWTKILEYINFPDIAPEEKDALTAVAFFLPMAISAIWAIQHTENNKKIHVKLFATVVGFAFFIIIGQRLIIDTIKAIDENISSKDFFNHSMLILTLTSLLITTIGVLVDFRETKKRNKIKKLENLRENDQKKYKEITEEIIQIYTILIKDNTKKLQLIFLFPSILFLIVFSFYAVNELGVIRGITPFLIISCLFFTIFKNPNRLLVTFGVVLAFLATSIIYDGIVLLVEYIENIQELKS